MEEDIPLENIVVNNRRILLYTPSQECMTPSLTSVLIYHEFILFKILITGIIDTIAELKSYEAYANL
jgi:hypothetical protein